MGAVTAAIIGAAVSAGGSAIIAHNNKPDLDVPEPLAPPPAPEEDAVTGKATKREQVSATRNRGFDIFETPTNNILPS
jgi:hypothetical protein